MSRPPDEPEELAPLPVRRRPWPPAEATPEATPADWSRRGPAEPARRGGLGVGLLLVVLVGAGALTGIDRPGRRAEVAQPPAGSPAAATFPSGDEAAPEGWRRGPPGPLRRRDFALAVQVWTGHELVVWGGDPDGDTGAAYDPAGDRWRTIARAPLTGRCQAAAGWTGREMLVWGRTCVTGRATGAAAYDPAADRWRLLDVGPLPGGEPPVSAWTGAEWLLVTPAGATAALDPAAGEAGQWRTLPQAPRRFVVATAAWSGREMLLFGTALHEKGPAAAGPVFDHWAAAFDPAANRWRPLPVPPFERAATAVWDGRRFVAWDQHLRAAALDPAGGAGWQPLPDLPDELAGCSPRGARLGDAVLAEECGRGAILRASTGRWESIPHPQSLSATPVWTGREALFWVGRSAGSADGIWLYRPRGGTAGPDGRHRPPVPMNPPVTTDRGRGSPAAGRSAAPG